MKTYINSPYSKLSKAILAHSSNLNSAENVVGWYWRVIVIVITEMMLTIAKICHDSFYPDVWAQWVVTWHGSESGIPTIASYDLILVLVYTIQSHLTYHITLLLFIIRHANRNLRLRLI